MTLDMLYPFLDPSMSVFVDWGGDYTYTYSTVPDPSNKLPLGPNWQLGFTPYSDLARLQI